MFDETDVYKLALAVIHNIDHDYQSGMDYCGNCHEIHGEPHGDDCEYHVAMAVFTGSGINIDDPDGLI